MEEGYINWNDLNYYYNYFEKENNNENNSGWRTLRMTPLKKKIEQNRRRSDNKIRLTPNFHNEVSDIGLTLKNPEILRRIYLDHI